MQVQLGDGTVSLEAPFLRRAAAPSAADARTQAQARSIARAHANACALEDVSDGTHGSSASRNAKPSSWSAHRV